MFSPKPQKYRCPQCSYTKIIQLESDVLPSRDKLDKNVTYYLLEGPTCPHCNFEMELTDEWTFLEKLRFRF